MNIRTINRLSSHGHETLTIQVYEDHFVLELQNGPQVNYIELSKDDAKALAHLFTADLTETVSLPVIDVNVDD